jgi:glycosyltransferase involved in cell wall biosynthesis
MAKRARMPLKIAAKIDRVDTRYFKRVIEPLLNDSHVELIGEISDEEKGEFLGKAYALLFPIDWPEPFGLVMIESIACGTPIIAYDAGSVSEVMDHGVTGFIVKELDEAVEAIGRVANLSRARCREVFEKRFTASRMAGDYVRVYRQMVDRWMKKLNRCVESSLRALAGQRDVIKDRKRTQKRPALID